MIWLVLMGLAGALQVAAPSPDEADIVVVGRQFEKTQGVITTNVVTGKMKCTVTQSSGFAEIDNGVCDVGMACMKARTKGDSFKACVAEGRERVLDDYIRLKQEADAKN